MSGPIDSAAYLDTVRGRLTAAGYEWTDDAKIEGHEVLGLARKSGFRLTKFGNSEELFVFVRTAALDPAELRRLSADAFRYALANKSCFLPRGLFNSLWVYAVALADSVDGETARGVRQDAPKKHWASAEIPAAVDLSSGTLLKFERTPMWGAAYYRGFRKTIERFLAP
jgi:hypothetical protein